MPAELDRDYFRTRPTKALQRLVSHALLQGRPLTTGHRWLNGPLFAQYALARSVGGLRSVDRPIFVLGTGRSGTTILGKVLSMHRHCVFLNEPKALWHAACRFEDVIGSYSEREARYVLGPDDVTPKIRRRIRKLYAYAQTITNGRRVVDKYPELIFRAGFVRRCFPDARFVMLVRNGWDTVASIEKWSAGNTVARAGATEDWWGKDGRKWQLLVRDVASLDPQLADRVDTLAKLEGDADRAAVEWLLTMRWAQRVEQDFPPLHRVRFEDLTADPQATLATLSGFCGLPDDPRFLAYAGRTLRPLPARPPCDLHPAVADAFADTLDSMGYG